MSLFTRRAVEPAGTQQRYSFQAFVDNVMKFGGSVYGLSAAPTTTYGKQPVEVIPDSFLGFTVGAFRADGVVFAIQQKRISVFSEARFQFRRRVNGRPGDLFGTQDLAILEHPWVGGTTGDLLARMLLDADLAGNAYWARMGDELVRLRPDWVEILLSARMAPVGRDGELRQVGWAKEGYLYFEGGKGLGTGGGNPAVFLPDEVCHFAPTPDPLATFRGMSWLTPVIREIQADKAATDHQINFLEHGGTPNMVITLPRETTKTQFELFKEAYNNQHDGVVNAYKPLFLTAGADATVVGANMQQLDMKALRGVGETRIAMAGGIHPVVLGSSEGMAGSSLNAGNYTAAKRATADVTFRPLWRNVCSSLEVLIPPPAGAELWHNEGEIAFLREDLRDAAEIQAKEAQTIRTLKDAGFTSDSVKAAVIAGDWSLLQDTGFVSVQLFAPPSPATAQPAVVAGGDATPTEKPSTKTQAVQ